MSLLAIYTLRIGLTYADMSLVEIFTVMEMRQSVLAAVTLHNALKVELTKASPTLMLPLPQT